MANSSFKDRPQITIPVTVPNGGTGRKILFDKALIIGAGTGHVNFIPPGTAGNILTSDGTSWVSTIPMLADESVSYRHLESDLVGKGVVATEDIDWSLQSIYTKTLSTNTVFTFSNYRLNKTITLIIDGNYTLGLPTIVKTITGEYIGTKINYITLHCTSDTGGGEVWAVINQEPQD